MLHRALDARTVASRGSTRGVATRFSCKHSAIHKRISHIQHECGSHVAPKVNLLHRQPRRRQRPIPASTAPEQSPQTRASNAVYESDDLLSQYLALHYGPVEQVYPRNFWYSEVGWLRECINFPTKIAQLTYRVAVEQGVPLDRALDLGCTVGGTSFELANVYQEVVGVDLSTTFLEAARQLQRDRRLEYRLRVEGELLEAAAVKLPPEVNADRVKFVEGDVCGLGGLGLGEFNAVVVANLLCRAPDPEGLLRQVAEALLPGGLLVVTTPYTWTEQLTPRDRWLGGYYQQGPNGSEVPVLSGDRLAQLLTPGFDLLSENQVPVVVREHSRKYQLLLPELMVWMRKGEFQRVKYSSSVLYGRSQRQGGGRPKGLWLPPSAAKAGSRPSDVDLPNV